MAVSSEGVEAPEASPCPSRAFARSARLRFFGTGTALGCPHLHPSPHVELVHVQCGFGHRFPGPGPDSPDAEVVLLFVPQAQASTGQEHTEHVHFGF